MGSFLLFAIKVLLAAQTTHAIVTGTVRNSETDQPIAGLLVALTDVRRTAITDSGGRYSFRDISAGAHQLSIRFMGFAPQNLRALVPAQGVLEINVALTPVEMRLPALVVRRSLSVRGVGDDDTRVGIDRRATIDAVRDDPMRIEPDVLQSLVGGNVVVRPESPGGLHVRGGASDQVSYVLDGIPVFSPYHGAGLFSAWNPDAMSVVTLASSIPSPGNAESLSGTVTADTRMPAAQVHVQGAVTTTQARLTLDGPVGVAGAGFLVALRTGLSSLTAPLRDESYLRGGSGDRIAKLEAPVLGGHLRLLRYDTEDEVNAPATADDAPRPATILTRNTFAWSSRSVGAEWQRGSAGNGLRMLGWHASTDAGSSWAALAGPLVMASARHDAGAMVVGQHSWSGSVATAGVRVERSLTRYFIDFSEDSAGNTAIGASTLVTTAFAQDEMSIGHRTSITAGSSLALFNGTAYASPGIQLRWRASDHISLSGSLTRQHQFAQSLRNTESAAQNVFPADLFIGAGKSSIPVARSDQQELGAEYRPTSDVHVAAHAYQRRLDHVLLVAPFSSEPFATRSFGVGRGVARGVSVEAAARSSRVAVVASYGLQRVTYASGSSSYVPDHGATHLFDGGVIAFPAPTWSIRLGVTGAAGRRATNVSGPFEWEACNLSDRGCEFSGSPRTEAGALGATRLPFYARADMGVRKQWHPVLDGRDVGVALFGAVTNVFSRRNVLTFAERAATGVLAPVEMRPLAPLVAGLDWTF